MSLNTAHANGGVLIYAGERILIFYDGIEFVIKNPSVSEFSGKKHGRVYLTSHRVIFNCKKTDHLQSFSIPFKCMREVKLEQPIFGANYISGTVIAETEGKWQGQATFELHFTHGGCIDFGQAMLEAGKRASRNRTRQPPPYSPPPAGPYYAAPPPAYAPAMNDPMYNFVPYQTFPEQPPANSVYMMEAPPPYPGIDPNPPPYNPNMYGGAQQPMAQGGYPPAQPGYPPAQPPQPGFNVTNGYPNGNDAKAQEASQSAYYNPQQPHNVYMPASAPPSYDDATKKQQ
ncbi:WW domain-binding protein 2-like [Lineus longissimus]|uniref:WW domain-binding protein 2-like n=1 Tax=Lineus longissimus TaxID=88925 RepID=UPI00315D9384